LQQGYVIAPSNTVAVGREFVLPKDWAGKRVILRFDAIHAGTHYWLNGRPLGYSENLFTPVEWDVTESALPGQTNRLALEMKTGTVSEALSYSSAYAFHDLGGIDRSVRLFALPATYITELGVNAGLDKECRDGELQVRLALCGTNSAKNLSVSVRLQDPKGRLVRAISGQEIGAFDGRKAVEIAEPISEPQQWSAEKPNLYHLTIELRQGKTVLETVEREVGFRRIEIRDRQLFVNGRGIKLAGACHHEFDALTGRADTMRHAETDVRLMKEANLNLIRTSHYPPTSELLDVADRLGMYVEAEAPFCWVGGALDTSSNLQATLTPTSAMIDYDHAHPSILFWSLANESHFNSQFLASTRMCKELDPTRPTTFNYDFANSPLAMATDIANIHYPGWPFEQVGGNDPRPMYFGEFFFPVCHEQTDVQIDPGLRELWGQGCAEPDSDFSRACAADFDRPPQKPGIKPGGWSAIVESSHLIGGSIWASHDDAFYFSATNHAGYAWHHGFWGLIDYWRRPKPEWFIARHMFSPVWLQTRHVPFVAGQGKVRVPVENRYAFTDFSELDFRCEVDGKNVRIRPRLAPGASGELEISVPSGTAAGSDLKLRVTKAKTVIHESIVTLGKKLSESPKQMAQAGSPTWSEQGGKLFIQGERFAFVLDRATGEIERRDPRHHSPVTAFPSLHLTRYDFGDLNGPNSPPYAVFPDAATRKVDRVEVKEESGGLRLTIYDRYADFSGQTSWLISRNGTGTVSCDYTYNGKPMDTREFGVRFELEPACEELKWRRWSEWGVFPSDSISRTEGVARAHRDQRYRPAEWNRRPEWPWALDETEFGTADFRSIKYNIYEAGLHSKSGAGLSLDAQADAHFRAALSTNGVNAYILRRCPLGQVQIKAGDHLKDEFVVQLE
jgi:beta-galactosidase